MVRYVNFASLDSIITQNRTHRGSIKQTETNTHKKSVSLQIVLPHQDPLPLQKV